MAEGNGMTQKEVNKMIIEELKAVRQDVKQYMECNEREHEEIRESLYKTRYGWMGAIIISGGTLITFILMNMLK